MRRQDGGAGRGARGRRQTQPSRSGGAGAPPGDTRTPRQELADGAEAIGLTGAKEARCPKGPRLGRPGRSTAARSAARLPEDAAVARREARHSGDRVHTHEKVAPLGAPHPRSHVGFTRYAQVKFEGTEKGVGLPGAANNTGDDACLLILPREQRDKPCRTRTGSPPRCAPRRPSAD
jgi:hypothetical protein